MSKQKKSFVVDDSVINRDKQEKLIIDRRTFAMLVTIVASGNVEAFLKTCDQEMRNEFGRLWDEQKAVPVGILFNRPNF